MKRLVYLLCALAWVTGCSSSDEASPNPGDQDASGGSEDAAPDAASNTDALAEASPDGSSEAANEASTDAEQGADGQTNPGSSLWVGPSGSDSGACTQDSPCKTLRKAVSLAQGGQTIYLQAGTYGADENYPLEIPDDVNLEGASATETILEAPTPVEGLHFVGNGSVRKLQFKGFSNGLMGYAGTLTAEQVSFVGCQTGAFMTVNVRATCTSCSFTQGGQAFRVDAIASFAIKDGSISQMGPNCAGGTGIGYVQDSGHLSLENVTAEDNYGSLELRASASATLTGCTFTNNGSDGCGRSTHIDMAEWPSLTIESSTLQGGPGNGIMIGGEVSIVNSTIDSPADDAIHMDHGRLELENSHLVGVSATESNTAGLMVYGGSVTITGSEISRFYYGIDAYHGIGLKVRNTNVHDSTIGVIIGTDPNGDSYNFGTASDPGGNTIKDCTSYGLLVQGNEATTVQATGNTWMPNMQGTNGTGQMPSGTVLTGPYSASGRNFSIAQQGPKIQF